MNGEEAETRRLVLEHAWQWFEFHATQRLLLFRFYLILTGAAGAAFFAAFSSGAIATSLIVSAFGMFASYCFFRQDKRVSELIKLAERVLDKEQQAMKDQLGYDEILIVQSSEKKSGHLLESYSEIFAAIFRSVGIAFLLAGIAVLVTAI